ncbi:MAG: ABC transporter ATP-binding protein [Caldilineaceae bacterium]
MSNAIVAQNLGKQYARYAAKRPTTLGEVLAHGLRYLRPTARTWALRHVDFAIDRGRTLGIVGTNGAGKSTLLRLLGQISRPDEGRLSLRGRIGALLDLGTGFHPDLTGRENIFISGVIAGLTRHEVTQRFDEIVEFAELGPRIDDPLRTYSTGMQMRLAFAVAAHIDPDILLIDEILAVGDLAFQRKCLERINRFKEQGCTIILVSHDPLLVQRLCDEAIWLHAGQVAARGKADGVLREYIAASGGDAQQQGRLPPDQPTMPPAALKLNENRFGSQEIMITNVRVLDWLGQAARQAPNGASLQVQISYWAAQPVCAPIFSVMLTRDDGLVCFESNTQAQNVAMPTLRGEGQVTLQLERLDLAEGQYFVDVGVYEQRWRYPYDYHLRVYPLGIYSAVNSRGVLHLPHYWQVSASAASLEPGAMQPQAQYANHQ